jgi:hypothetical protein
MSFNGMVGTNVQVPGLTSLGVANQPFSIEMWVNVPSLPATGATLAFVDNGAWCTPFLGINAAGNPAAQVWMPNSHGVTAPAVIPTGTWVHLAQTWSPTNGLRLYVNGELAASDPTINTYAASGTVDTMTLGNWSLSTGCGNSPLANLVPNVPYQGLLDSVQIYSRERTPGEIQSDAAH